MLFILKLDFSPVVSFDDKNISSSNYFNYLEMSETTVEDSKHWFVSVYNNFIKIHFSYQEIHKIRKNIFIEM